LLTGATAMQSSGVAFDPERVFIVEQLDFAVDNMLRILVSGILKPEMKGLFEEKAQNMIHQAEEFGDSLALGLDPETVADFQKMIQEVEIKEATMLEGVRAQLIDDHGMYLSFADGEILVTNSPPSPAH
jgi:hypothetical protein